MNGFDCKHVRKSPLGHFCNSMVSKKQKEIKDYDPVGFVHTAALDISAFRAIPVAACIGCSSFYIFAT